MSASYGFAQKVGTSACQMKIATQKQKALEEAQNQKEAANIAPAEGNTFITPTRTPGPAHSAANKTDRLLIVVPNPSQ